MASEPAGPDPIYNTISLGMLSLTALSCLLIAVVMVFNPLGSQPEATQVAQEPTPFLVPTETPTLEGPTREPTFTPSPTFTLTLTPSPTVEEEPTETPTSTPAEDDLTATAEAEETASIIEQTITLTPTPEEEEEVDETPTPVFALYALEEDSPVYQENPEANGGCTRAVIAGEVRDVFGDGVTDLIVTISGPGIEDTTITGAAQAYGEGGWEFVFGDGPTDETYTIQLLDADEEPITQLISVEMVDSCDSNRAILIFREIDS